MKVFSCNKFSLAQFGNNFGYGTEALINNNNNSLCNILETWQRRQQLHATMQAKKPKDWKPEKNNNSSTIVYIPDSADTLRSRVLK